jgi:hypothetical protein
MEKLSAAYPAKSRAIPNARSIRVSITGAGEGI